MAPENHGNPPAPSAPPEKPPFPAKAETQPVPPVPPVANPVPEKPEEASKAVKALLDSFDLKVKAAVEEAVNPLKERIKTLESEPANGGPARRAIKSADNPKMEGEKDTKETRITTIKAIMADTPDESLKRSLSWELARLTMDKVIENGPQRPDYRPEQ
jgi:hypothetical protein